MKNLLKTPKRPLKVKAAVAEAPQDQPATTPESVKPLKLAVVVEPPMVSSTPTCDNKVTEIRERLEVIENDLDEILEEFRIKPTPHNNRVDLIKETRREMIIAMEDIAKILIDKTHSDKKYSELNNLFGRIKGKGEEVQKLLGEATKKISARAQKTVGNGPPAPTPASTPAPSPVVPVPMQTSSVDLSVNDRIERLEEKLVKVTTQIAEKANASDLTALSGRVNDGFDRLMKTLAPQTQAPVTAKVLTPSAPASVPAVSTPAAPPTAPASSAPASVPAPAPVKPAPVTPPPATTLVARTNEEPKKKKKSRRESVNFFALVLGIVLGVLALIAMFFYATRSQTIDAERIGASDAKSAAVAEIENARRLQMETMDKMHSLQQNVEGYRRQKFVMPPPPTAPAQITTNKVVNSSTTNVVVVTNIVQDNSSIELHPTGIRQGFYVDGYWSPTPMQDRYSYKGFNGFIYPH